MTDTLVTADGRSMLRLERAFPFRVETVWGALVNAERLNRWYPAKVDLDPRLGGPITLDYKNGVRTEGTVLAIDGPQLFAFTEGRTTPWGAVESGEVRFEIHPEVGGSLLVFRHTFGNSPAAATYAAGWEVCFEALELLLAGQPVVHAPVTEERIAHYVELFGLDQRP